MDEFKAQADEVTDSMKAMGDSFTETAAQVDDATKSQVDSITSVSVAATESNKWVLSNAKAQNSLAEATIRNTEAQNAYAAAQERVNALQAEGSGANADQLATAELAASKAKLTSAQSSIQLAEANKTAQKAEKDLGNNSSTLANVLKKSAMIGGLAALAVGAYAVDSAVQYQDATQSYMASANVTQTQANKTADAFLNLSGTSIFTSTQMLQAYGPVAQQFDSVSGKMLTVSQQSGLMSTAMTLADASGNSLSSTVSSLASIYQTFGQNTSDVTNDTNVLLETSDKTGTSISALTSTFDRVKASLGVLSPTVSGMGGLLVDLAQHGETGRKAMATLNTTLTTLTKTALGVDTAQAKEKAAFDTLSPSLRQIATEYQNGQITSTEFSTATSSLGSVQAQQLANWKTTYDGITSANLALKETGIKIVNAKGNFIGLGSVIGQLHEKIKGMTQAQALATIGQAVGTANAAKLYGVIKGGESVYLHDIAMVTKHNAAQEAAAAKAKTVKDMMDTLKSSLTGVAITTGQELLPEVLAIAKVLGSATLAVAGFLKKNKEILPVLVGVGLALGAMAVITKIINSVKAFTAALGLFQAAEEADEEATVALDADMDALPFIAIVAAIALVVVGFIELYKHCKLFRTIVNNIASFLKTVFIGAIHGVVDGFKIFIKIIGDVITIVGNVIGFIKNNWPLITAIIGGPVTLIIYLFHKFHTQIVAIIHKLINDVVDFFKRLPYEIGFIIGTIVGFFIKLPGRIWSAIMSIPSLIQKLSNTVESLFIDLITNVVNFFAKLPGRIWSAIVSTVQFFFQLGEQILAKVENFISGVVQFFLQLPGRIASAIGNLWNDMAGIFKNVENGVGNTVNNIVNYFKNLPGQIMKAISGIPGDVGNIFSHIPGIGGLESGIKAGMKAAASGAYITKPTMLVAGEAGPELVIPMNDPRLKGSGFAPLSSAPVKTGLSYAPTSGTSSSPMIYVDLRNSQVLNDQAINQLGTKIGQQLARTVLPNAGVLLKR